MRRNLTNAVIEPRPNAPQTRVACLKVEPVRSRKDRKVFLKLAHDLYHDDDLWVPPILDNIHRLLGWKKHPFHEFSDVESFLARRDGLPVGRITAIVNREHNRIHREQRGFLGFFEATDDVEVSRALFGTASQWLRQRNMTAVRGPMNPSLNYEAGLLVDGFDATTTFMMPRNHPYYARLWADFGFKKAQDLLSYIGTLDDLPEARERLDHLLAWATRDEAVDIVSCEVRKSRDVQSYLGLYNRAMRDTWAFVPLTEGEMRAHAQGLRHLLIRDLALGAKVKGELVGMTLGLPDYTPAVKLSGGRLFPFGFRHYLRVKRRFRRLRQICTAVLPEYQKWGISLMLLREIYPEAMRRNVTECEYSYVFESNKLARYALEKGGARIEKRHRIYDLDFK